MNCLRLLPALLLSQAVYAGEPSLAGKYKGYNLLIISITNISTEHMGLYGYDRDTTPDLDKLAAGALVFDDAFTPASWTLPAGISLFTSLSPYAHKIMSRRRNKQLPKKILTLPEILKAYGYTTAAFTGGLDYMGSLEHLRGFETRPDNPPFTRFGITVPQAEKWLSKERGKKFFLFVHGYDAHPPFLPGGGFKGVLSSTEGKHVTVDPRFAYRGYMDSKSGALTVYYHVSKSALLEQGKTIENGDEEKKTVLTADDIAYLRDLYDETILGADSEVGALIASLGKDVLARTVVVVLSEHGEMFAKHGRFGRAGSIRGTMYEDVVHVPLLMMFPGVPGRRISGLVQLVDVMPTLLQALGVPAPRKIQGKPLEPLITDGKSVNEYVYGGTKFNFNPQAGSEFSPATVNEYIRGGKWKLIHEVMFTGPDRTVSAKDRQETYELYDVTADSQEAVNVAAKYPEVVKDLSGKLETWAESSKKFEKARPAELNLPAAVLEDAKKHGYW